MRRRLTVLPLAAAFALLAPAGLAAAADEPLEPSTVSETTQGEKPAAKKDASDRGGKPARGEVTIQGIAWL